MQTQSRFRAYRAHSKRPKRYRKRYRKRTRGGSHSASMGTQGGSHSALMVGVNKLGKGHFGKVLDGMYIDNDVTIKSLQEIEDSLSRFGKMCGKLCVIKEIKVTKQNQYLVQRELKILQLLLAKSDSRHLAKPLTNVCYRKAGAHHFNWTTDALASISDIGTGTYLIPLEKYDGDLKTLIIDDKHLFSELEKMQIAKQIALGLKALHDLNIMHRDLHLANILHKDNKTVFVITDFGESKRVSTVTETNPHTCRRGHWRTNSPQLLDSMFRLSNSDVSIESQPEHIKMMTKLFAKRQKRYKDQGYPNTIHLSRYGLKTDIYSYGIFLYELSANVIAYQTNKSLGTEAFLREGPVIYNKITCGLRPDANDDTKHRLKQIYTKCWNFEPTERPNIDEVLELLQALMLPKPGGT